MLFKLEFIFLFSIFLAFNLDATNRLLVLPGHKYHCFLLFVHSIYLFFSSRYTSKRSCCTFRICIFFMLFSQTLFYIVILCHAIMYEICIFLRIIDILFITNLLYNCYGIPCAVFYVSNFVSPTSIEILFLLVISLVQEFTFDCSYLFLDTRLIFDNG